MGYQQSRGGCKGAHDVTRRREQAQRRRNKNGTLGTPDSGGADIASWSRKRCRSLRLGIWSSSTSDMYLRARMTLALECWSHLYFRRASLPKQMW